jgi:diketogulonate reductase-like aldo/keto reductase
MNKISTPTFIYGTAWKGNATTELVKKAVRHGFTAIDTANQPKHYSESLVGDAIDALQQEGVKRTDLFLQTKFTSGNGQDTRIPYDPNTDYTTQVNTSFKSSLEHLKTDYVDAYLLHGPYSWPDLVAADWEVWHAIETLYHSGQAKLIGVSNVNIRQLELFVQNAKIKPMIVQNRCFAAQGWDQPVREFCLANNIIYQGFSLLTANPEIVQSSQVAEIAKRLGKTPTQIIFRFAMHIGILPLTGTTNEEHMQIDLQCTDFELTSAEKKVIETLSET